MTECCASPPNVGTWKIYVRNPVYYPNRVKYDWNDGTGEQIIEAKSYIINESLNPEAFYWIIFESYARRAMCGWQNDLTISRKRHWVKGTFSTGSLPYADNLRLVYLDNGFYLTYAVTASNVNFLVTSGCAPYDNSYLYNYYDYEMPRLISIEPASSDATKNWNLKIFDENNNKIYDQTRSTQPTASLIPEQCLQGDQKEFVRVYQNNSLKDYCLQEINGNRTLLLLMSHYTDQYSSKGIYIPIPLAYKSSDEKCALAPIFEVECVPCKKCPENTCEVFCGDQICCYDFNGVAVDSFPIEELCP